MIDLHELTMEEKRQILYNHMRLGGQPQRFRSQIKPHLEAVAASPQFVPEVARRLGDPIFTKGMEVSRWQLMQFVEKKEQFLKDVLLNLDSDSKAALALIFMRNGALLSPVDLRQSEVSALARMGSDLGKSTVALSALKDSLVRYVIEEGQGLWRFKHPTIGDAFAALLLEDPELMGIYLQSAAVEKLIYQVTCGDVGLEHAVIVPKSHFVTIRERLSDPLNAPRSKDLTFSWGDMRMRFFARRCDRDFLREYLSEHPEVLESVSEPGLSLDAEPAVEFALRLFELRLLPEANRKAFVEAVSQYAVDGEDGYAFRDSKIRKVFQRPEWIQFVDRLREELVPSLPSVRRTWQSHHNSGEDPEQHVEGFISILDSLEKQFPEDRTVVREVSFQRNLVMEWISENYPEPEDTGPPPRLLAHPSEAPNSCQDRSIFDDVDA